MSGGNVHNTTSEGISTLSGEECITVHYSNSHNNR